MILGHVHVKSAADMWHIEIIMAPAVWQRCGRAVSATLRAVALRLAGFTLSAAVCGIAVQAPAAAQSTRSFGNTTSAAITNATPCTTPILRTFTVTSNFIVGDVDLGFFAPHTWRGDIRITLQSPAGTRQQLVDGDANITSGDNLNVRLNDGGSQLVNSDDPLANHSVAAAPPYQHNFIPNAPLAVFNGQTSGGTWVLEVCDIFPSVDDGTFIRSDLYLTPQTSSSGTGATFVVSSTADSGTATLRQAVIDANSTPAEADTIRFAIPGAGPHTITLSAALPTLTDNGLLIDGTSQPGTQCRDLWVGSGHDLRLNLRGNTGFNGFRMAGANQTIRGLSITGFSDGVELLASSNTATLQCNYIGLLANGTSSANAGRGVHVLGVSARVGGVDVGQGNVISSNSAYGVQTRGGSTDTAIRGNFIGTDAAGMVARGNGISINNQDGSATWRDITRNLVSGNGWPGGITLEPDDRVTPSNGQIRIQGNIIGFTRTLSAALRNGGDGLFFDAGSIAGLLIGGNTPAEANTITGEEDGVDLRSASNVMIRGNTIAASGARGLHLNNVSTAEIGGSSAGQGNSIGGNASDGIYLTNSSSNITILGNLVQPITILGNTLPNGGNGVWLDRTSNVTIGNGTAAGRNVIGGNRRRAIQSTDTNSAITINGNYIGTDASGNAAVGNGQGMDIWTRDAVTFSSGNFTGINIVNNVVGGHAGALIEFWDTTASNVTIQGNSLGVGVGGASIMPTDGIEPIIFVGGPTRNYSNLLIGGSGLGQGNIIANGANSGIRMESTGSAIQVVGNTIRNNASVGVAIFNNTRAAVISNRIFANGLLGIDLDDNGVTANDAGDGDGGSNDLLNFPQSVSAWVISGNQLRYNFTLDAPAAANGYRIEFFANSAADPSGHGEGERYLGHVDIVHPGGMQSFSGTITSLMPVAIGDIISATATRRTAGGAWDITSEFSAVVTAQGIAVLTVVTASDVFEPSAGNPFATPGNDLLLTTTVNNVGNGSTDADSIFAVVSINPANAFLNAVTSALSGVVGFNSASPGLTFNPANDLRFSNAAQAPTAFAQCTYTPVAGYDPQVRHVCLNPKGTLPTGSPQSTFNVRVRVRVQ